MYDYADIKSVHLEVTSKCQAKCPMCPRRVGGGPLDPYITLEEMTLEQFKEWFPIDFIQQLHHLNMCGNLGDPIIAQDTLEIYQYLRKNNPTMSLHMHTNGSARSRDWWKALAKEQVEVVFGIDGLEDTHHLYRVSTSWPTIIKNAKTFIDAGGVARWDMLAFAHNEHQIDACKKLSQDLGFKNFFIKHTSRFRDGKFNVINEQGRTTHILYPTTKSDAMIPKIKSSLNEILPEIKCKAKNDSQIYISATGNVSPCCWLDMEWMPPISISRIDYMDKINSFPNLRNQTLKEIFNSGYFRQISSCWSSTGLRECGKQCGSFDKLGEQYVK
jgi:MoaA/NifB/PqqE/SkfB family radical SAM enzyme